MSRGLGVVILLLVALCTQAQPSGAAFVQESLQHTIALYTRGVQGQTILYNGTEYGEPRTGQDEHPFFPDYDWIYGSVIYHGHTYDSVPMLYDINTDKLVIENYNNAQEIALVSEKVAGFTIGGHRFRRIINESVNNSLPVTGFYEILYDGPTRAILRRQKILTEIIVSQTIEIGYDEKTRYFVLRDGVYLPARNKASLLKILGDEKQALKPFIKKNKLRFRRDPVQALTRVVARYDTLIAEKK